MHTLINRLRHGRSGIALADQIMVSASNFAAGIVLVRGLGLPEFGKYTIAYALLLYANSLQMSFIGSPMLSLAPMMAERDKRQFIDGMLAIQVLASAAFFMIFAIGGVISRLFTPFFTLSCAIAFASCVGTFQLQDWLRRYYFVYNKGKYAIISDFISYVVQLLCLLVLWRLHALTLVRTFLVMCITSVTALVIGPVTDNLRPATEHLWKSWAYCKTLSRDLFIANQVRWFGFQGVLLVGTAIVGTAAIGGLRAAQNLSGPVYLFLIAIENIIPIRIAEELKRKGTAGAYAFTQRAIWGGTAIFCLIVLPVGLFGREILRLLYGPAMIAFYWPMVLQLICIVVQAAISMWLYFYRGLQETRALLQVSAIYAIVNIATVYWLGRLWQAPGIVLSSLLAQVIAIAYCVIYWTRHSEALLLRHQSETNVAIPKLSNEYADTSLLSHGGVD